MKQIAKFLFLCVAPLLLAGVALLLICTDLICRLRLLLGMHSGKRDRKGAEDRAFSIPPAGGAQNVSIVIPNWNGKDLLEKYLPTVIAACSEQDEIIVVDNASTDGSAEFIRRNFPRVNVITAERNLGFGGGSNLGIQSAQNRIVVLLNNDMRVEPGFLRPLLEGFTDDRTFAVTTQIFFSDSSRRREETGLTSGCFEKGFLRVRHEIDGSIQTLYPTFYAGGGSTAYDRDKFRELGGFDSLFEPFYLEDTDLSYCAWRKGWKVLYQPESHVFHEHRATIGKHYAPQAILAFLQKNYVLMVWKNVHRWRWLAAHFFYLYSHMLLCWLNRGTETRTTIGAFLMALRQLPQAMSCRSRALLRAEISDTEVFARTRPSIFRETFGRGAETRAAIPVAAGGPSSATSSVREKPLNILFVSPYSIFPPVHGGAVFMLEAIRELAKRHHVHVLTFVDRPEELESNRALRQWANQVEIHLRQHRPGHHFGLRSHAEETFRDPEFAALLDKLVYLYDIDVIQFEYTQLAQYRLPLHRTPQCLFEHDVYFRSVARQLRSGAGGILVKSREFLEWLRAVRFETAAIEKFDAVFTCHENEQRLLESMLDGRRPPIFSGLRTAIDVASHPFPGGPRRPESLLFVGNFQHNPNVEGLQYFCREILPLIRQRRPTVTFSVVGANASAEIRESLEAQGICMLGQVPDIREPLRSHAVFVCPILSGAGMRVKILEAFASGIPVVSTTLGAEGLAGTHGTHYLLADSPTAFADAAIYLLENSDAAQAMAARARQLVETNYDWASIGLRVEAIYRGLIAKTSAA